jgi:hypothetical protein
MMREAEVEAEKEGEVNGVDVTAAAANPNTNTITNMNTNTNTATSASADHDDTESLDADSVDDSVDESLDESVYHYTADSTSSGVGAGDDDVDVSGVDDDDSDREDAITDIADDIAVSRAIAEATTPRRPAMLLASPLPQNHHVLHPYSRSELLRSPKVVQTPRNALMLDDDSYSDRNMQNSGLNSGSKVCWSPGKPRYASNSLDKELVKRMKQGIWSPK